MIKKTVSFLLALNMLVSPSLALAAPTIPGFPGAVPLPFLAANSLPQPRGNSWQGVQGITQSGNQLTITQNAPTAIIDWNSFNIGASAAVYFSQAQPTWAALNRIYDGNPSLIYGNLKADGQVYLINRNGIFFGPNSQVNVHGLVASALNIKDQDFTAGLLRFTTDDYTGQGGTLSDNTAVANYGTVTTDNGGFVALVGPQVANGGTIASPIGKIALIGVAQAGSGETDVEFNPGADSATTTYDIVYNSAAKPGVAINTETGSLIADTGRVDMQGATVTQNGLVRAVSTVKIGGEIYLLATDSVTTGPTSKTLATVSDSTDKASQTFAYSGGTVTISGISTSADGTWAPGSNGTLVKEIIHNGDIEAPSGTVNLDASERIYLETGSRISVGGVWVDEPASANLISAQLNSVQLADSYTQKGGVLQGQKISTTLQDGSNIGNIGDSYQGADMTTRERSTTGGQIVIGDQTNAVPEFIAKQGATLDFSGGGFNYAAGVGPTTMLLSGNKVYDISNAPANLSYRKIVSDQTVTYAKYGVTEEYQGLYLGGGTPLYGYLPARTVGSNAGSLSINARQVVLDSALNGSVTRGEFQTHTTDPSLDKANSTDKYGTDYLISVARGLEEPVGGTLTVGNVNASSANAASTDYGTGDIVVHAGANPLPASFGPNDPLGRQQTELSAQMLSDAGLSKLTLYSNSSITIEPGAKIALLPGGSYSDATTGSPVYTSAFTAKALRIDDQGQITVPGGSVELTLSDNVSENASSLIYVPPSARVASALLIDNGSVVSVAGEMVDNSRAGVNAQGGMTYGHINGGAITIQDQTAQGTEIGNSVIVRQGAVLDVSGGYSIDTSGNVTGGDAGSLTLRGNTLSVAGELRGFSLPGNKGGSITLHAGEIDVASQGAYLPDNLPMDAAVPDQLAGKLVLGQDRLASTGFTRIELDAIHDVTFENGVMLSPSTVKSPIPVPAVGQNSGATISATSADDVFPPGYTQSPDYVGPASVTVKAGVNICTNCAQSDGTALTPDLNAKLSIPVGTGITTIPGGSIALNAPYMGMNGTLAAPGGNVTVTTNGGDLEIGASGRILAGGYNKPTTATVAGVPAGPSPQSGGTVTLTSSNGSIILDNGSQVDVSGSSATQAITAAADGRPVPATVAGNPGSLTLSYYNDLNIGGEIDGHARLAGVQGGTLTVNKTGGAMAVTAADLTNYLNSGFDAITFRSPASLNFHGSMDVSAGRSITLDAPVITGANDDRVKLAAPWITLINSSDFPANSGLGTVGDAHLTLYGGWVDVSGSMLLSGFSDVLLQASQDIRLTNSNYTRGMPGAVNMQGDLTTAGNLTLQAARIYPSTAVDFTIAAGGEVTTLPGAVANTAPIYSAGGSLTINGMKGVDHEGFLAAPMGSITLESVDSNNNPVGRVYLADGSVTTTSAAAPVYYGTFDGTSWYINHLNDAGTDPVTAAPGKSITINGNEAVVMGGAKLDASGGGSVYSYFYQSDIQGTTDPVSTVGISALTNKVSRPNRYVILPDNSVQLPGFAYTGSDGKQHVASAVYLDGIQLDNGTYLKAGTYSLLPEQFAFLPGALVISDLGKTMAQGMNLRTPEGYQVVGGYATVLGTGIKSQLTEEYSVRSASDVLKEGNFSVKQAVAGDAGSISITGNSTVMAASLNVGALPGYNSGSLTLSGKEITVQETAVDLPAGFDFSTPLPDALADKLQVVASSLSGMGLGTLKLGDSNTSTLDVTQGSVLTIPNIILNANAPNGTLTIESGAQVNGTSATGSGTVTLSSTAGTVDIQAGALVHASNAVSLNANDVNLNGNLKLDDHGSMSLEASEIFFVSDSYTKGASDTGLYLSDTFRKAFANYDQVTLTSSSDLNFKSDATLAMKNTALTLDAGQFTGPATVTIDARTITLQNSGNTQYTPTPNTAGSMTLKAEQGIRATGDVVFSGFGTVNLTSASDLTLLGAGSLKTAGDLNLTAARVTTSYYRDASNTYNAANFQINATGAIGIMNSGGVAGTTTTPGGTLAITGSSITQSGIIEVASGQVQMTATGDITLESGAQILAPGTRQATAGTATTGEYDYAPGGQISLSSNAGSVNLASGSLLNVSAAEQGDAGTITLAAPTGTVTVAGALRGNATAGVGGSFSLDTNSPSVDLTALNAALQAGGFTGQLDVRARQGDLTLAQGQTMTGHEVMLEADSGAIDLRGAINADAADAGGRVELYAGTTLTLESGGSISARGTGAGASGGSVLLSSKDGSGGTKVFNGNYALQVKSGAQIDVSGTADSSGAVHGGTVAFRAYQGYATTGDTKRNDVNMASLPAGSIIGASQVSVEAARNYSVSGNVGTPTTYLNDASNFMTVAATPLETRLFGSAPGDPNTNYHLQAGIELDSTGVLTLNSAWDLSPSTTNARPGGEPGVLTLRAAGNLNISSNLVDHPTSGNTSNDYTKLTSATMQPSWGINLVAGADLSAASPFAVNTAGTGDLTIASNKAVYTEDAPIRFASANNTNIATGYAAKYMINSTMAYSLASYGGDITGTVGNNLVFKGGGAIQTATGDIDIKVGGDLDLYDGTTLGSVRTTGEYAQGTTVERGPGAGAYRATNITDYWTYRNGGDITLDVDGEVAGNVNTLSMDGSGLKNGWDYAYGDGKMIVNGKTVIINKYLAASFEGANATQGIATMGGGDIRVRSGGSFTAQIGTFGTSNSGNLDIVSGGDITGRFRVMNGTAALISAGNFGDANDQQVIELAKGWFSVAAQGDVYLGAVLNPNNSRSNLFLGGNNSTWNLTYGYRNPGDPNSADAGVYIASLAGNITYTGSDTFDGFPSGSTSLPSISYGDRQRILPPSVSLTAAGDILIQNDFYMAPSPTGNLQLFAGGSIDGLYLDSNNTPQFAGITMSDLAPANFYGPQSTPPSYSFSGDDPSRHALVHQNADAVPVEIAAGTDIRDLRLYLPKQAEVRAGQDIENLVYVGQNISATDMSSITAGRDIFYDMVGTVAANSNSDAASQWFYTLGGAQTNVSTSYGVIEQGGPGTLIVQAGRNINLGTTSGIQSVGNADDPLLSGDTGSNVIVTAGAKQHLQASDASVFFNGVDGRSDHADESQNGIRQAGIDYTNLKDSGDMAAAQQRINEARTGIISKLFDEPAIDGSGSLSMTKSQISATNGKADIYILARSDLDVGTSALSSKSNVGTSGIYTAGGGAVNIYSGGDVNVNQSRVMTYLGGDITVWSDQGNINAGRGSATAVSPGKQLPIQIMENNQLVTIGHSYQPPAVGSGIRAVTSDPNTVPGGPLPIPQPGNIYGFTPNGVIDAGEAGIAGGKVVLGATQVLNAQNISFSAGSVGVPSASGGSVGLGALAGAGSVTDNSKMLEQSSALGAAKDKTAPQANAVDDFMSKWLDVKIINFDTDSDDGGKGMPDEQDVQKRKKLEK